MQELKVPSKANPIVRIFSMLYMLRDDFSAEIDNSKKKIEELKRLGYIGSGGKKTQRQLELLLLAGQLSSDKKNTKVELSLKMEVEAHQAIVTIINKLHVLTGRKYQRQIEIEMVEDRIKDLHSFLDTILQIKNIEILKEVFDYGLNFSDNGEKSTICSVKAIEAILNTHVPKNLHSMYLEQLGIENKQTA